MKEALFLVLCCSFTTIFAQEITKLQDYLPPSPEAQEFIKYGEYPVGMYTGIPNISIPIYTIEAKDIQVPISLSYHSSGIQVDQIASWAGLGWSLGAGGTISRIPKGIPDDAGNGFLNSTVVELSALTFDHDYYEDAATGLEDTESDIYSYNFAGYSGKFFFDRNKEIRLIDEAPIKIAYQTGKFKIITKEGITFEFNDVETTQSVTYSQGNPTGSGTEQDYTSSWHLSKITSKNLIDTVTFNYEGGTSFSNQQYNYSESIGNDIDFSTCPPSLATNVHSGGGSQIASQVQTTQNPKRLKEIVFPSGKVVFNRLADRQDMSPDRLDEILIYQKNGVVYNEIKSFDFVHNYFVSTHTGLFPTSNPSDAKRKRLKLTELREYDKNGVDFKKYTFDYDNTMLPPIETNGKDFWGYYNGKNSNQNLIPLQQPIPNLSNDVGAADRNPDATYMKAGILNKITYPTGGYTEFLYEPHEYESTETSTIVQTKSVFAVGLQNIIGGGTYLEDTEVFVPSKSGYATVTIEASDLSSVSGVYPRVTLQRAGSSGYLIDHSIDPNTYSYPMNPPEVQKTFAPVWLDQGVSYTLKAVAEGSSSSLEFDGAGYMHANIDYNEESTTTTPVMKIAGGLRIQQIKSYSTIGELAFSKRYAYNSEELITPETFLKEQYLDSEIEGWSFCNAGSGQNSCYSYATTRRFYYGGTVQGLTMNGGSPVVYRSVDELVVDGNNNDLGKTSYTYAVQTDDVLPVTTAYQGGIMILKKDWMGGQNTSTKTYASNAINDNDYITSALNGHTIKRYDDSYKMYKIVHAKRISGNCTLTGTSDTWNRFDIIEYPIFRGVKLLSSSHKTTKMENGNEVITSTTIFYDNETHLQPTRTVTTSSDDQTVNTMTLYPDDVKSSTSLGAPNLTTTEYNAIDKLKTPTSSTPNRLHQIAIPVQVETTVKDAIGAVRSTTVQRNGYKDLGSDQVLPELAKSLKGVYSATTNPMENRIIYHKYDDHDNPLEVFRTDGVHVSYIWGYDKMYPVAKVENATRSQIEALSGFGAGFHTGLAGLTAAQETALRGLGNAMVTTYTYDPLVGVTSITDFRGYKTTYIYDDFNRLKEVRDQDNNLVTDYLYHYQN